MHKLILSLAAAAALGAMTLLPGAAQAAPGGLSRSLSAAAVDLNMVEDAQYIYGGRNYCFYLDGWHGPGWYWCGYSWRRGYGWGGGRGWRGWAWHGRGWNGGYHRGWHGGGYHRGGRVYHGGSRSVTRSRTVVRHGSGASRAVVRHGGGGRAVHGGGGRAHGGGGRHR
jgi:hypothetical protein